MNLTPGFEMVGGGPEHPPLDALQRDLLAPQLEIVPEPARRVVHPLVLGADPHLPELELLKAV